MSPIRVTVYGRNKEEILPDLARYGLVVEDENPEVVISYGGDGSLLAAERQWPGVPKVALRDSKRCHTCSHHSNEVILQHLADGTLKRTEFIKLRARARGQELICFNNVILHNASVTSGVRYKVWIDEEAYGEGEIIGDGLVVSTPFGSAAYYRSITHSLFRVGIGLAFNNSIEPIDHLVLGEDSVIRVQINRGPAIVAGDQAHDEIPIDRGDEVLIQKARRNAVLFAFDAVKYPADQFIFFNEDKEQ